jgi:hypothetical protein
MWIRRFNLAGGYALAATGKRFFKNHLQAAGDGHTFSMPLRTGAPFFLFEKWFYGLANNCVHAGPFSFGNQALNPWGARPPWA